MKYSLILLLLLASCFAEAKPTNAVVDSSSPLEWEEIAENTYRLKVEKGWAVRHKFGYGSTMIFVDDHNHNWLE